jgi:hypothetical protein
MSPESAPLGVWKRWLALDLWLRTAVVVWVLITLAVCARSAVMGHKQSVYQIWHGAGRDWLTRHDLYDETSDPIRFGYRYSPLVAALFTSCELVPDPVGNVIWRLINAASFLTAVACWLRFAVPLPTTQRQRGLIYLLLAPLAQGSLNNGQVNLLLIALMLGAVTAVVVDRWTLAAGCMALAVMFKIYPAALGLLLVVAYPRRFPLRFLAALAVLAALPFLMQHPDYVLRQYALWWDRVSHGDTYRRSWPLRDGYRDLWLLVRIWQLPISLPLYTRLQVAGGAVCAVLCALTAWRRWPDRQRTLVALALGTGWMVLMGPSPESCTYILAGPALVWWIFHTRLEQCWVAHYLAVQAWGLLAGCLIAGTGPIGIVLYQCAGLQPIAVLLFGGSFLGVLVPALLARSRPGESALCRPEHPAPVAAQAA